MTEQTETKTLGFGSLKKGMHVRLKCQCQGFITEKKDSEYRDERWFSVIYTIGKCAEQRSFKGIYSEGADFKTDIFYTDTFSRVMPVEATPAPDWFQSLEMGPFKLRAKRFIRVHVISPIPTSFVIPGSTSPTNAYVLATTLREKLDPTTCDVATFEVEGGSLADACKMAESIPVTYDTTEKNKRALHDWVLGMFATNSEKYKVQPDGRSPLLADDVFEVLDKVREHSLWNGHRASITSREGTSVALDEKGNVIKI